MRKIHKIVLTGGPCAGKTTALNYLQEKLSDIGFKVFLVPEVATMMINMLPNLEFYFSDSTRNKKFQAEVICIQDSLQDSIYTLAKEYKDKEVIIIHDRGFMDNKAYMDNEFAKLLLETSYQQDPYSGLKYYRDSYDSVFHLRTSAIGAEEFYTLDNNSARRESAKEAKDADERTLNSWIGHPHLRVIENNTKIFEDKLKKLLAEILRAVGHPTPLEIERKFLVKSFDLSDVKHNIATIEQYYLNDNENNQARIRKRTAEDGSSVFYRTHKHQIKDNVRAETEERISEQEYHNYKCLVNHKYPIVKTRTCFVYNNQYFELDQFKNLNLTYLEIELTEENDKIDIPPFIEIDYTTENIKSNFELYKILNGGSV